MKSPPSTDRFFDRLFWLWKFALLIVAIWWDEFQLSRDFHTWKLFYGTQCLLGEGGPLNAHVHCAEILEIEMYSLRLRETTRGSLLFVIKAWKFSYDNLTLYLFTRCKISVDNRQKLAKIKLLQFLWLLAKRYFRSDVCRKREATSHQLVFEERGKPEYPEKTLSMQSREPTNSTHIWRRVRESNPGHIGDRRVLSPLRHPCTPLVKCSWCHRYCFRL